MEEIGRGEVKFRNPFMAFSSLEVATEALIKELQGRLGDENISDEEMRDVVQRLTAYNQVKVTIANKIQRLIL